MGFGNDDYDSERSDLEATINLLHDVHGDLDEILAEGALDEREMEWFTEVNTYIERLLDSTQGRKELYEINWKALQNNAADIETIAANARRHTEDVDAVALESYSLDYINSYLDRIIEHACTIQDDADNWKRRKDQR